MDWNAITNAVWVLVAVGAVSSMMLVIADRFMSVPSDERADAILEALPGANCGACGYAGCADYATAVVKGAPNNLCIPGGSKTAAEVAAIMGEVAEDVAAQVAVVRCRGYCDVAEDKYDYTGVQSCKAAANYYKGELACSYGCLGFGDCVSACKFGAMHIIDGVAQSDFDLCNGCGACAAACPKRIIDILPLGKKSVVFCNSHDRGAVVRKNCGNGCIGCGLCVKACNYDAVHVVDNLAVVDNEKCVGCEACAPVCPTGAIGILYRTEELALESAKAE